MGQLAESIKQAEAAASPPITAEMLKEADPTSLADVVEQYGDSAAAQVKDIASSVPGISQGWRSFLRAGLYGGALSIPAALLVAYLKRKGFEKSEKRRSKLLEDYLDVDAAKRKIKLPPSDYDVPIKAAHEKKALSTGGLAALGAGGLLAPAIYKYIANVLGGSSLSEALGNLMQPTENPWTHPLGAPLMVGLPVAAAGLTSHFMDKRYDKLRKERIKREREQAEAEFQKALEAEFSTAKSARFNERVDKLADVYTRGNFSKLAEKVREKVAEFGDPQQAVAGRNASGWTGLLSGGTGLYLLGLMMLTHAASSGAWDYAKKHDEGLKRTKALERLVRRRALATPATLTAYREEKPDKEKTIAEEPI